jgi:hypothetical protein
MCFAGYACLAGSCVHLSPPWWVYVSLCQGQYGPGFPEFSPRLRGVRFRVSFHTGALYTWGYGEYGRLGHRDTASRLVPTLVAWHSLGCERVAMAACGASHTAVVTESGRLYTWGDAESAQV